MTMEDRTYVDTFPFPVTREVLEHGRERYMIYCVVCHDPLGTGRGKIVERGYTQPPSYHIERLRNVAVGHFFEVITNGYGSMPDYKQQVPPRDRWAIAAYIRALQLSQHFPVNDKLTGRDAPAEKQRDQAPAAEASREGNHDGHPPRPSPLEELEPLQRWSLGVGVAVLAVCILGALVDADQFFRAYLAAYLFYLGIAHGSLAILMVYHLTGGAWGFLIRNILEAGMRTLPLLAALFVPIALGVGYLYVWADPEEVAASTDLQHKQIYLNVPFFIGRAAAFTSSCGLASRLLPEHLVAAAGPHRRSGRYARWQSHLSGPGLVVYGITIFFASTDWIMSLQPAFRSTIIAPLFASGEILVGFACALLVMAWLVARPPLVVSADAVGDLGSLLFTFLIIWAYMAFFQFMLIWIANLPYDVMWYLPRSSGGWQYVAWALFVFHFAMPFFLLLMRDVKQQPADAGGSRGTHTLHAPGLPVFQHHAGVSAPFPRNTGWTF